MDVSELNRPGRGRPKGSRNKISESFLSALSDDFDKHGLGVIQKVREEDPAAYLKIVAGLLPKEIKADVSADMAVRWMSDAELDAQILSLDREIAAARQPTTAANEKAELSRIEWPAKTSIYPPYSDKWTGQVADNSTDSDPLE